MALARWSEDVTFKFVSEYIKHDCLWDQRHVLYKIKEARSASYKEIMEVMGIEGFEEKKVVKKIRNIRSTYSQELKKIKELREVGTMYIPSLKWFKTMHNALKNTIIQDPNSVIDVDYNEDSIAVDEQPQQIGETSISVDAGTSMDTTEPKISSFLKSNITPAEVKLPVGQKTTKYAKKRKVQDLEDVLNNLRAISASVNNPNYIDDNEFEIFGRHIGAQLRNMPLYLALQAQQYIQTYLSQLRLDNLETIDTSQGVQKINKIEVADMCFSPSASSEMEYDQSNESDSEIDCKDNIILLNDAE